MYKSLNTDITTLKDACDQKIVELKTITTKRKASLLYFWSHAASKKTKDSCRTDDRVTEETLIPECVIVAEPTTTVAETESTSYNYI